MFRTRLDCEPLGDRTLPAVIGPLPNGVLTVIGTEGADTITVRQVGNTLVVQVSTADQPGVTRVSRPLAAVTRIVVEGLGGNDVISLGGVARAARANGGGGDDLVVGGARNDILTGGGGNDFLFGLGGDDRLFGDDGDDFLDGGTGRDVARGGGGTDSTRGRGGDDVLDGEDFGPSGRNQGGGGGGNSGNSGRGGGGLNGTVASQIEGTITAIDAAARRVVVRLQSGQLTTLQLAPTTKLERNDFDVPITAFRVGDRAEAKFDAAGRVLQFESVGP